MSRKDGIDEWVDRTHRIVLLGDAAHPSFVSPLLFLNAFLRVAIERARPANDITPADSLAGPTAQAWPSKTPWSSARSSRTCA